MFTIHNDHFFPGVIPSTAHRQETLNIFSHIRSQHFVAGNIPPGEEDQGPVLAGAPAARERASQSVLVQAGGGL